MITVRNLTKTYGSFRAVDDVTFTCEPGTVTGFLGPNGAGKSTTMRIIAGLTPPDRGEAHVSGVRYRDIPNPGTQVGVLLDASAQHNGRSGREILKLGAMTMGLPDSRVQEMLDLVSLSPEESRRRLRNYSLGMRQRLGIAHALLGDPKILILDEPANGLDPQGIRWMRELLREYANRGGTVLLSSHLLHEVQQIADELILIGRGRVVRQGTTGELLHTSGAVVDAGDRPALRAALTSVGIESIEKPDGLQTQASPEEVGRAAAAAGVALVALRPGDGASLEDLYLELTADTQRGADPASSPSAAPAPSGVQS